MAGVYIKGMDKPKKCRDCPFNIGVCAAKVAVFEKEPLHDSGEGWCPLVEVPDHGDLIDREDLLEKAGLCISDFGTPDEMWRPDRDWYLGINAVPKVIPADKEGV